MGLSDANIRNAKPSGRQYKLTDEKGLFILVNTNGSKLFRMKYRFDGKEKILSFGAYPDVSLRLARDRRDEARKLLAQGEDPGELRKAQRLARSEAPKNTFEAIGREWMKTRGREWSAT
ncbi:MAG: Arm DNA-binding domain-containing protein, partial [Azoarcus sp.]|nr:Arm DNA-binding domain-containing protein [Azoarcus sp.]